jgi:hypothetical protein
MAIKDILTKIKTLSATISQKTVTGKIEQKNVRAEISHQNINATHEDLKIRIQRDSDESYGISPVLFKRIIDLVSISELFITIEPGKETLDDVDVVITEQYSLYTTKALSDFIASSETLTFIFQYGRMVEETVFPSEVLIAAVGKNPTVVATVTEQLSSALNKVLQADVVGVSDSAVLHPNKSNTDVISFVESLSKNIEIAFTDLIYPDDNVAIMFEGSYFNFPIVWTELSDVLTFQLTAFREQLDTVSPTDQLAKHLSTSFSDTVITTDVFDVTTGLLGFFDASALVQDVLSINMSKSLDELFNIDETIVLSLAKVQEDTVNLIETATFQVSKYIEDLVTTTDDVIFDDEIRLNFQKTVIDTIYPGEFFTAIHSWEEAGGTTGDHPVLFPFDANSDGFTATTNSGTVGSWVSNAGHPVLGALENRLAGVKNTTSTGNTWTRTLTFEDMGVPIGSTVTAVTSGSIWTRCSEYNTGATPNNSGGVTLVPQGGSAITIAVQSPDYTAVTAWTQELGVNATGLSYPSSTSCTITWTTNHRTANSTSAVVAIQGDSIAFTVSYETAGGAGGTVQVADSQTYLYVVSADEVALSIQKIFEDIVSVSDDLIYKLDEGQEYEDSLSILESLTYGIYPTLTDIIAPTDVLSNVLSIFRDESLSASDIVAKHLYKTFEDTVTLTDTFDYLIGTTLANLDSTSTSDTYVFQINKQITDTIAVTDVFGYLKESAQAALDTTSTSDVLAKQIDKQITDTIAVTDVFASLKTSTQSPIDTTSILDDLVKSIAKVLEDSISTSDVLSTSIEKNLSVSASTSETHVVNYAKAILDTITTTDSVSYDGISGDINASETDTITMSETGNINVQDYVDGGYFEDYVGTNYSF